VRLSESQSKPEGARKLFFSELRLIPQVSGFTAWKKRSISKEWISSKRVWVNLGGEL